MELAQLQMMTAVTLQRLVAAALLEVCPLVAEVSDRPREAVTQTQSRSGASARAVPCLQLLTCAGPDFACHAPVAAWLLLRALARAGTTEEEGVTALDGGVLRVTSRSRFGALRTREYACAASLSEEVLEALPSADLAACVACVRVQPGGALLFTSTAAFAAATAEGRLHCGLCGSFFGGQRGLRDHVLVAHRAGYSAALSAVSSARQALLPATPQLAALSLRTAAALSSARAARDMLPEGLRAARDGNLGRLRELVAGGWDALRCADRHGSTALLWAAGEGRLECVAYLLDDCGVPPGWAQPRDGRTALHWAARNGHLAVCRFLVQRGVSPDEATRDGTTAFHWAAYQGQLSVLSWLADEAGCDWRALNAYGCNAGQWAAQHGDLAACAWLLERGLDWGVMNGNGHSCLHKAAIKGQAAVCAWLLDCAGLGLAHMAADNDGNTPSNFARQEGFAALADELDRRQASIAAANVA